MTHSAEIDAPDEDECGYTYDHDEEVVYEGEDGIQWYCRRCGAEGWTDPEPSVTPPGQETP